MQNTMVVGGGLDGRWRKIVNKDLGKENECRGKVKR